MKYFMSYLAYDSNQKTVMDNIVLEDEREILSASDVEYYQYEISIITNHTNVKVLNYKVI